MSELPEIEINETDGPLFKLKSPDGLVTKHLKLDNNGLLKLDNSLIHSYSETTFIHFDEERYETIGWGDAVNLNNINLKTGTYELIFSCNWGVSNSAHQFLLEATMNDNSIWECTQKTTFSTGNPTYKMSSLTKYLILNITSDDSYNFKFRYKCDQNNKIGYISYVFFKIQRIS